MARHVPTTAICRARKSGWLVSGAPTANANILKRSRNLDSLHQILLRLQYLGKAGRPDSPADGYTSPGAPSCIDRCAPSSCRVLEKIRDRVTARGEALQLEDGARVAPMVRSVQAYMQDDLASPHAR